MKSTSLLFYSLWLVSIILARPLPVSGATEVAGSAESDRDWQAIIAVRQVAPPRPLNEMGPLERAQWRENYARQIDALGAAFIARYPEDQRRWQIMADLVMDAFLVPSFVIEWGPPNEAGEVSGVRWDEAALQRHRALRQEWLAQLRAMPDLPVKVREYLAFHDIMRLFARQKANGVETWVVPDFSVATVRAKLLAFGVEFPGATGQGRAMLALFIARARLLAPEAETEEWKQFLDSPNAGMAGLAQARLRRAAFIGQTFDFAFTALDGRAIDLKKLRGKVVLIDFWATWCGPCLGEVPNILAAYRKYHDQGFEVVGVALEMAGLKDDDTPEQRAAKVAKTKQMLATFTAARGMAWPQYFDERHPKNDLAGKYEIQSIPAMFLLDQNGLIVSTDARGPKLEAEVKRLLGL